MTLDQVGQLLISGGPGVVALLFVFWIVFKELPEQRVSREKMMNGFLADNDKHREHTERIIKEFRSELTAERTECRQERILDREARHAVANALNGNNLALTLLAEHSPQIAEEIAAARRSGAHPRA